MRFLSNVTKVSNIIALDDACAVQYKPCMQYLKGKLIEWTLAPLDFRHENESDAIGYIKIAYKETYVEIYFNDVLMISENSVEALRVAVEESLRTPSKYFPLTETIFDMVEVNGIHSRDLILKTALDAYPPEAMTETARLQAEAFRSMPNEEDIKNNPLFILGENNEATEQSPFNNLSLDDQELLEKLTL